MYVVECEGRREGGVWLFGCWLLWWWVKKTRKKGILKEYLYEERILHRYFLLQRHDPSCLSFLLSFSNRLNCLNSTKSGLSSCKTSCITVKAALAAPPYSHLISIHSFRLFIRSALLCLHLNSYTMHFWFIPVPARFKFRFERSLKKSIVRFIFTPLVKKKKAVVQIVRQSPPIVFVKHNMPPSSWSSQEE